MNTLKNRSIRILKNEQLLSLYAAIFGFVMKTIQILGFYDKDTGLIRKTFGSNFLGFFVVLAFFCVFLVNIKIAVEVTPVVSQLKPRNNKIIGFTFFLTGILFFIQGNVCIGRDLANYKKNIEILLSQSATQKLSLSQKISELFPTIADVLCIISSLCFIVVGIIYITNYKKTKFIYLLIPVIWGGISLIAVLLSLSNVVSMESNGVKIGFAILAILFLYYTTSYLCSYGKEEKQHLSVFVRISFVSFSIMGVLPYVIAFCFGKKDLLVNSPYYSYIGLLLFSIPFALEYYFQTIYYIKRKDQLTEK